MIELYELDLHAMFESRYPMSPGVHWQPFLQTREPSRVGYLLQETDKDRLASQEKKLR